MKKFLPLILAFIATTGIKAQIGYQVALMDQSTGKPRANETVSATVTITDNAGTTICSTTKNVMTNEFGMMAIEVGDSDSFKDVDWSKLPLWVTATVGGITVGKSQVLNVPIAEHANHWGTLTKKILCSKTWSCKVDGTNASITFSNGTTCSSSYSDEDGRYYTSSHKYAIYGNLISITSNTGANSGIFLYDSENNVLVSSDGYTYR